MSDLESRIARITQPYLFQNTFILTDLPAKDKLQFEQSVTEENRKRGDVLFRQGTYPKGVFWIVTGKVKILQETGGQRQTMYIYSDGDLIGYRQLISDEANPVSAVLLENSLIRFIPGDIFKDMIEKSPLFARNVLTALAREFTIWMNRTTVFTQFPVRRRLILALLILYQQYLRSGSKNGVITITRTELAEYVGASLETVVRVLNTLKENHGLKIHGRTIQLMDPGAFADLVTTDERKKN